MNFVQLNSTFTIFAQNFLLEITSVLCILFLIKICAFQNQEVFFYLCPISEFMVKSQRGYVDLV